MARKSERDTRIAATSTIWGLATIMLALCIPLVAITNSGAILPLAVVLAATVATVTVWRSWDDSSRNRLSTNSVKQLEQRVTNLEIIYSSQELDLHHKIKQLESKDS